MELSYTFVIPVFNRPKEVQELLTSFTKMDTKGLDYDILIVEDGSTKTAEKIVDGFKNNLPLSYLYKENSGPGASRNYGMQHAQGNYFLILDSDVLMPEDYLQVINSHLARDYVDCFGGADAAEKSFTPIQKAINFSMTSLLTTGGIRGKKNAVKKFEPRSFNMGISKKAFEATGGFGKIHPGEDPDLSIKIEQKGFKTAFIPAYVYHKRRIDWQKFYTQVHKFGLVRPILNEWHPQTSSIVFWFPTLFTLGLIVSLIFALFGLFVFSGLYVLYFFLIFIVSTLYNKSLKIGFYSVYAVFIQFLGYGLGFLKSSYFINLLGRNPKKAFPKLFFD